MRAPLKKQRARVPITYDDDKKCHECRTEQFLVLEIAVVFRPYARDITAIEISCDSELGCNAELLLRVHPDSYMNPQVRSFSFSTDKSMFYAYMFLRTRARLPAHIAYPICYRNMLERCVEPYLRNNTLRL